MAASSSAARTAGGLLGSNHGCPASAAMTCGTGPPTSSAAAARTAAAAALNHPLGLVGLPPRSLGVPAKAASRGGRGRVPAGGERGEDHILDLLRLLDRLHEVV